MCGYKCEGGSDQRLLQDLAAMKGIEMQKRDTNINNNKKPTVVIKQIVLFMNVTCYSL